MSSVVVLEEYYISSFATDEEHLRSLDHQKSTNNYQAQDCPLPRTTYQQVSSYHLHLSHLFIHIKVMNYNKNNIQASTFLHNITNNQHKKFNIQKPLQTRTPY
jgi:hypothetical protein